MDKLKVNFETDELQQVLKYVLIFFFYFFFLHESVQILAGVSTGMAFFLSKVRHWGSTTSRLYLR